MPGSRLSYRLAALGTTIVLTLGLVPTVSAADPAGSGDDEVTYGSAQRRATVNVREAAAQPDPVGANRVEIPRLRPRAMAPGTAPAVPTPRVPDPATSSGAPAPDVPVSFAGLTDIDNDPYQDCTATACLQPSDPWVAVGPSHVFQAVNTMMRITNRAGGSPTTLTFAEFFGWNPLFNLVADPRVVYDARHNRWLAIELSFECAPTTGFIDLAVSNTSNPTGAWTVYSLTFPEVLPDYPGIGTSADKIVLSSNNFDIDEFCAGSPVPYRGAQLFAIDWATLLTLPSSLPFAQTAQSTSTFTYRPALGTPVRAGQNTVPVIAEAIDGSVLYRRVTGTIAAGSIGFGTVANLTTSAPLVSGFDLAPAPRQSGSPSTIADAVDERPTDAVWQNNRLVFVSTYPCDLGGGAQDCVRVVELDTSTTTPTLTQDFLLGEDGFDFFMGGVGLSGGGDLHVVYSKSSPSDFVTTESVYQRATDTLETISDPAEVSASTEAFNGTRWGDYVGVAQDPVDSSAVWQGDQVADNSSWVTQVTQMRTDGAEYVPIEPLRVLDSRDGTGLSGKFNHKVPRTLQISGVGVIPNNAAAITGNLTVVNQTGAGFVSVTTTATATPSTSTINFPTGDTRANNLTIPLSPDGEVSLVYNSGAGKQTDLLLDVTGYFVYDDTEATYVAIDPVRVLDSRDGTGVPMGPFEHATPRNWDVATACGDAGVGGNVVAVTGNVTVTGQTARGFVSVTPTDVVLPDTSTINFPLGDTRANGIAVQLDVDGSLSATYRASAGRTTHILFDLTGCFTDDGSGDSWFPLEPTRRLDTRSNTGLAGPFVHEMPLTLSLAGAQFLESTATGITGNLTVTGQQKAGFVSMTTAATVPATTSTINFPLGDTRANGVFGQLGSGNSVLMYTASGGTAGKTTELILDVTGYFR